MTNTQMLMVGVGIAAAVYFLTKKPTNAVSARASQHGYNVPPSSRNLPNIYYRKVHAQPTVVQDPPYVWPYEVIPM